MKYRLTQSMPNEIGKKYGKFSVTDIQLYRYRASNVEYHIKSIIEALLRTVLFDVEKTIE